ncbi:hypothetical protein ACFL5V_10780 [Fibrobacterota bacterium]
MLDQIIQCLSCGRVKQGDNSWIYREISPFQKDISHTYCSQCIQSLQDKLMTAREFKKWDFQKQVDYLAGEIDKHQKKHDRMSFKNYIEEFFNVTEEQSESYYDALKEKFLTAVCPKCRKQVVSSDKAEKFGSYLLHHHCYKDMAYKIKIILENGWNKTNKLDAYLDLLRIEKEMRPALKEILQNSKDKAGTTV